MMPNTLALRLLCGYRKFTEQSFIALVAKIDEALHVGVENGGVSWEDCLKVVNAKSSSSSSSTSYLSTQKEAGNDCSMDIVCANCEECVNRQSPQIIYSTAISPQAILHHKNIVLLSGLSENLTT